MMWEKVKLEDIVKLTKGKKHSEVDDTNAYRYLQIEDLHGSGTNKYTNEDGVLCDPSDLLIAWDGANAGKVGTGLHGMAGSTLARISVTADNVSSKYLYWYLSSNFEVIKSKRTGATIPHVNGSELRSMMVPLPPLHIQEQIADTLDKADALHRKDQELLQKYDELAQAIFYDMFGDPVRNERGWEVKKLGELTSHVSSGSTPLGGQKVYKNTGVLFIRSQNVLMRSFDISDAVFIDEEIHQKMKRTWVKHNDVLMNITGASIGRIAVYEGEDNCANVNQHVCIIRTLDETVDPHYLMLMMATDIYQAKIIASSAGGTRESFTFEQIKQFSITVPPLSLQKKYSKVVKKIKDIQLTGQHTSRSSQKTFNAIMSEYFS